ncbi:hypothetical protein CF327_g7599, partial [Tilletia walkeri]
MHTHRTRPPTSTRYPHLHHRASPIVHTHVPQAPPVKVNQHHIASSLLVHTRTGKHGSMATAFDHLKSTHALCSGRVKHSEQLSDLEGHQSAAFRTRPKSNPVTVGQGTRSPLRSRPSTRHDADVQPKAGDSWTPRSM